MNGYKRKKLISIRLDKELLNNIDEIANNWEKLNRTAVIERLLKEAIEKMNKRITAKLLSYSLIFLSINFFAYQLSAMLYYIAL